MSMLLNDDNQHVSILTAYNGVEDVYKEDKHPDTQDGWLLPQRCCGNEGKVDLEDCGFLDVRHDELKEVHRKMIMGEPFVLQRPESDDAAGEDDGFMKFRGLPPQYEDLDGYLSMTPIAAELAVDRALEIVEAVSNMEYLLTLDVHGKLDDHMYTAISLIRTFIQLNFTGPDIPESKLKDKLEQFQKLFSTKYQEDYQYFVEMNQIPLDKNVKIPELLLMARHFLTCLKGHELAYPFYLIWVFRIDFLHQRCLTRRSISLSQRLKHCAEEFVWWILLTRHAVSDDLVDVKASFLCEIAEMLEYYYDRVLSEQFLAHASEILGIQVELSGRRGFRTRFQQTPLPQTVALVKLDGENKPGFVPVSNQFSQRYPYLKDYIPKSELLNDDTRLERVRFVNEEQTRKIYKDVGQLIVIREMTTKQGFQGEEELRDMKRQEQEALINEIIDCPVSCPGRVTALVTRCRLEKDDIRAIDRTHRQLGDLLTWLAHGDFLADVLRQYLFFGTSHPMKHEIKALFGEVLLKLEHWNQALDIYTDLNYFHEIVRCYMMSGRREKAEECIQEKIAIKKTPELLVLLGDATSNLELYEEAWELSGEKYVDAPMRLGLFYYGAKDYEVAGEYFKLVLEKSPLDYPCWVKLAWCCYETKDYETGYMAYLRAVNLEYDNYQAWNNLATCAYKLNKKDQALRAYKEAAKCSYDEWKVWSNLLNVSVDVSAISEAVQAYHRCLDLRKNYVNEEALEKMVNIVACVIDDDPNIYECLKRLLGHVVSTSSRSPMVYVFYARLLLLCMESEDYHIEFQRESFERAMQYYEKALGMMRQNASWKSEVNLLQNVVNCTKEFRGRREQYPDELIGEELIEYLQGRDNSLRQTAGSVLTVLQQMVDQLPTPNEKVQSMHQSMTEELMNPFYA